jgi:putative ABC transport system permease protein
MLTDVRFVFRSLVRQPGFAAATITTLALGIGASTAMFTLAYSVWLKPLPYADAARLVTIRGMNKAVGARPAPISDVEFEAYSGAARSFRGIAAYMQTTAVAKIGDEPRRIVGYAVSRQLFDVLGTRPALGRGFEPRDEVKNAPPVVVLSDAFWRREWGGDPSAIGKTVPLFGMPATIIGVMPRGFAFPYGRTDAWQPLSANLMGFNRGMRALEAIGRLADEVALESAQGELESLAAGLAAQRPDTNQGWSVVARPLHDEIFSAYRAAFATLLGAAGFLLLVACANVGGLLMSRQISRQPVIALQIALGATRQRVLRGVILESLMLAAVGGAVGILLAWTATPLLAGLLPRVTPRVQEIQVNAAVLIGAVAISLVSGVLSAMVPVLRPLPVQPNLQFGSRAVSGTGRLGLQSALVGAQLIVCIVLLLCGGLMLRSFVGLTSRSYGFTPERLLTAHVSVPIFTPDQRRRYSDPTTRADLFQRIIRQVATVPGVTSSAAVTGYPGSSLGYLGSVPVRVPERPAPINAALRACSAGYFRTMDVPFRTGRMFDDADVAEAVVTEALARQLWGVESAIGKQIVLPPGMGRIVGVESPYSVVGVVENLRAGAADEPAIFIPAARSRVFWTDLVIRTSDAPSAAAANIRTIVRSEEKDLLIEEMIPISEVLGRQFYLPRAQTFLVILFAALSILLTTVGLYSLTSHFVALRTAEFGVRITLGAKPSDVRRLVMRRGLVVGIAGAGAGLVTAALVAQALRNQLFGLQQLDLVSLAAAPAVVLTCALLATFMAARHAGDVRPIDALKSER